MPHRGPHWSVPVIFLTLMVVMIALTVARFVRPASDGLPVIANRTAHSGSALPPFRFVDQNGASFGSEQMFVPTAPTAKVWVADFIFTNCAGPCPIMTLGMAALQKQLRDTPDVGFVSFTVDPERDAPDVLARYAREYGAGPGWHFLTGPRDEIQRLCTDGFALALARERFEAGTDPATATPESRPFSPAPEVQQDILHSTLFVLLDAQGRIRGYFDGERPDSHDRLARAARALARDLRVPPGLAPLPAVNATLNACATILLLAGYAAIRARRVEVHRVLMLAAVVSSALFLVSYLVYHAYARATPFVGQGAVRAGYYAVLATHIVLAAVIAVLVPIVLVRALRGDLARHRRLARIAFPMWVYVSVTGVVIYVMLYHVFPAPGTHL